VVPPVAEAAFLVRQRHHRAGETLPLPFRPVRLRLVEHRNLRPVVQLQERHPPCAPRIDRDGHHDPAEPGQECSRLVEIPKPAKCDEVSVLHSVLRRRPIAHDASRHGVRHRLRSGDDAAERIQVAVPGTDDERIQRIHDFSVTGRTPSRPERDMALEYAPQAMRRKTGGKSSKGRIRTIDGYLSKLDPEKRKALQHLRRTIHKIAPRAEECISYGLPAFRLDGRMLVWFGAATNHCSFYPGGVLHTLGDEVKKYDTSKGTIRFQPDSPLPATLVRKLVKARIAVNAARLSGQPITAFAKATAVRRSVSRRRKG
jgi:uncharacterized protein YdhG (YjbR/CyaY superfamily)